MACTTVIVPIPQERQAARSWRMTLNGQALTNVASVQLDHPRLGTLHYGQSPAGYDGWTFHETGGGGAVTLPFCLRVDGLHVGLIEQLRHNQGRKIWNAPRGFLDPNEAAADAATRELAEETKLSLATRSPITLSGERTNPNSTFFETREDEGVAFFGLELAADELVPEDRGYAVRADLLDPTDASAAERLHEQIGELRFFHWTRAVETSDMFTVAAIARLLAHLQATGRSLQ